MSTANPSIRSSIHIAVYFILLLWVVKLLESVLGWNLYWLGVYPRHGDALLGILSAPLIHGSWQHIMSNTLPTLLLGSILIYGYPRSRWWTLVIVWLLSGLGVWLFGRESYHFGASGLTHGMFFFLLLSGLLRRDRRSAALLMIAFFMYSGMLLSVFPGEPGVSFEYHLFGALSGLLCAFAFRHWDPKPQRKVYPWERRAGDSNKDPEEEDPIIGDQWKMEALEEPGHKATDDRLIK
jgi:membrane associated rhomboid family serine protease